MRYLIQFRDKSTKRISEAEAKALMASFARGKPAVLRGAYLSPYFVDAIKPISKDWFDKDFVVKQLEKPERVQITLPTP